LSDLSTFIENEWNSAEKYAKENGFEVRILDPATRLVEFVPKEKA
jgi:hypothetical protein